MITEEFEVLLYKTFTTLKTELVWHFALNGKIVRFCNKHNKQDNKICFYQTQKCKTVGISERKRRHYSLFEQMIVNNLQIHFCFHEDLIFFLLPVFRANVYTVILLSTHTEYLTQEFV